MRIKPLWKFTENTLHYLFLGRKRIKIKNCPWHKKIGSQLHITLCKKLTYKPFKVGGIVSGLDN